MNLFRVRGIQLAVHFSFFLLLAVYAFNGWVDAGPLGAFQYAGVLVGCFVCVVLHEFGHCFTAMHFGIGVRRILLMPIGGMAEFEGIPRQPGRELLITLAGPAVNFVIAGLLWLALPAGLVLDESDTTLLTLATFGLLLMKWNLGMGCFNLLPAFPMDGGRIFRALLATRVNYLRATFWAATVGKVLCVVAATCALVYTPFDTAILLVALFTFIFLVGELEYRAARRREMEDAHMRATLERLYPPPVLPDAPPLLQR
jgi:Zn-dependent protease